MDKSLDEIISERPRARRGQHRRGRGVARQQLLGRSSIETPANKARRAAGKNPNGNTSTDTLPQQVAEKIMLSGLPTDVNESQIRELFLQTVGPLRSVILHYTPNGKWTGTATVQFSKRGDAAKAYNTYNDRLIDGKKPLKIELMFDPAKAVRSVPLSSRVTPAVNNNGTVPMEGVQRTGGRPRRGRGGRGGRGARPKRPIKTVVELDAEMEDYSAANGPAAAPSTAMAT